MYNEKKSRFIKMPVFEGGQKALKQFINDSLKYPVEAIHHKIEGTIQVFFIIGNKGNVIEAKTLNSLGFGCDEEAIRVIKLLQFKIPKTYNVKATFNKKINIHFNFPKENPKPVIQPETINNFQIQYSITTQVAPSNHQKKINIEYTIKLDN